MRWTPDDDMQILEAVDRIRDDIARFAGIMPPKLNTQRLVEMASFYQQMEEKAGKFKAMRDEYFANLLRDSGMAIGRAEGLAKGSEFGQKKTFYENTAAGYLEILQSLKKVNEYHDKAAMNRY